MMSALRQALVDYLAMRRALGFKLERHGWMLPKLVDFLEQAGARTVSTELALAWSTEPVGRPGEWAIRLSVARGFAAYLQSLDPATEVPPANLLPRARRRPTPYLYSDAEIEALMAGTAELRFPFRAATYRTLIGLLSVTGMRIGEAIALDRDDFDRDGQSLLITGGKPGAPRWVPLHPSTIAALDAYAGLREERWPRLRTPALFVSTAGTRLLYRNVHNTFATLAREAGLAERPGGRQPSIHGLRHSFAVATLIDWYRHGADVAAQMPRLSTYLGHAAPKSTYWYLQAAPELLALAAARLEQEGGEQR
jgi:integrase